MTTSSSTRAAMDKESFPPSIPGPSCNKHSLSATHACHILAPSPSILAAHIQLQLAFTSRRPPSLITANMRFVSPSATVIRACASGLMSPLMGCSPTAVAVPFTSRWDNARTPTLARGVWSGPTHCCCATSPLTLRSTLFVKKRLLPTSTSLITRSRASVTVVLQRTRNGCARALGVVNMYFFCGILPSTRDRGRSKGTSPLSSSTVTRPSPVIAPTALTVQFSLFPIAITSSRRSGCTKNASFSWYSAPHSSREVSVGSPLGSLLSSYRAPNGSTNSFNTLPLPPQP